MNYKFCTGCFQGNVIEEGTCILDIPYALLDDNLKERIIAYANRNNNKYFNTGITNKPYALVSNHNKVISMDTLKDEYELSWVMYPTEDEVDLFPASQW